MSTAMDAGLSETENEMSTTTQQQIATALGSSWRVTEKHGRIYLAYDGRQAGYLVSGDDGSTGTCRNVTVRQGGVASALRKAGIKV